MSAMICNLSSLFLHFVADVRVSACDLFASGFPCPTADSVIIQKSKNQIRSEYIAAKQVVDQCLAQHWTDLRGNMTYGAVDPASARSAFNEDSPFCSE